MKIGILSMQRVENFGSFLQAYGLKSMIESLGHKVVFIDYRSEPPVVEHSQKAWRKYALYKRTALYDWLYTTYHYRIKHSRKFALIYRVKFLPMLGVSYRRTRRRRVDIAVIGSDEVFNCLQKGFYVGFSPMLFGQNIHAKKVISYAACFGYTTLEGLERYGLTDKLGRYLRSFAALSVRDENSRRIIQALVKGSNPAVNLDPVLMYDFELPALNTEGIGKFAILYTYPGPRYTQEEIEQIRSFCAQNGLRIVTIGKGQTWVDQQIPADPFQLLAYFRAADFIITDTFHGTVFSIKYNKNFVARVRTDNENKLGDLISRLKMDSRRIEDYLTLQSLYDNPPDFEAANRIIAEERERAMRYLDENLRL